MMRLLRLSQWLTATLVASTVFACSGSSDSDSNSSTTSGGSGTSTGGSASSTGTSSGSGGTSGTGSSSSNSSGGGSSTSADVQKDHESSSDYVWDTSDEVLITLSHTSITTSDATKAVVAGTTVTLNAAANYRVQGTLDDGSVIVNTSDANPVRVILDGASITHSTGAALDIESADKVIVVLAADTASTLTDGANYVLASGETEPNAGLYSKADLTIYGLGGSLTVTGKYNDAIGGKDGLILRDANVTVNSVDDGIRGKDYVIVRGNSEVSVTATGDGIKSDNEEDTTRGYVTIESGTVNVTSGTDGIQAQTYALVEGGTLNIKSGGGSTATLGTDVSAKGIKADVKFIISGGTLTINSADDAIHSKADGSVTGGTFTLTTGDQGFKVGDSNALVIDGGNIIVTKSREALGGGSMTINDGFLRLTASDDGLSVSHGNEAMNDDGSTLYINGGTLAVYASGDGIDTNGSAQMTGGTVLVHGPTDNGNGPLDYNGTFVVTGGLLVAAGSSGMAQAPSTSSSQPSLLVNFTSSQMAGSLFHLQDASGNEIVTFAPSKTYQSVAFSSPSLALGTAYSIYLGGTDTGTVSDGLYTGGTYTPGTLYQTFTPSSSVTTIGSGSNQPGGGGTQPGGPGTGG